MILNPLNLLAATLIDIVVGQGHLETFFRFHDANGHEAREANISDEVCIHYLANNYMDRVVAITR